MANIQNYLNQIKTAVFGKDVRESIHDAIKQCYDDASINHDNANMEVKLARGSHNTLNDRLDENEKNQENLSSQLDNIENAKMNKTDVLTMANMGQDVKEAMTGGSVAVVGKNTVTNDNVVNKSIDENKMSFISIGNNLYNKDNYTNNKYLDSTGNAVDNVGWAVTGFVPVLPSVIYSINMSVSYAYFYDINKNKISSITATSVNQFHKTFTTPENAYYCRFSFNPTNTNSYKTYDKIMINVGSTLLPYEDYKISIRYEAPITNIADKSIKNNHLSSKCVDTDNMVIMERSKNLFNKNDITIDVIIDTSVGNYTVTQVGSFVTNSFIPIEQTNYWINVKALIYYYDSSKAYIKYSSANGLITPPTNAVYCKLGFQENKDKNTIIFYQGNKEIDYVDYYYIPSKYLDTSQLKVENTSSWDNKKTCTLGDSITEGNTWQPYLSNYFGFINTNCGIGGTTLGGTSTNAMWQDVRVNAIPLDTEVLFIMGGSNDWAQNIAIGTIKDADNTTFMGAYKILLNKIYARIPNVEIIIMTQPFNGSDMRYDGTEVNSKGHVINDYRKATREIANRFGLPIVETIEAGINNFNKSLYIPDEVHPNAEGGKLIASVIIGKLKAIEKLF